MKKILLILCLCGAWVNCFSQNITNVVSGQRVWSGENFSTIPSQNSFPQGLLAWYPMNEPAGTVVLDATGNGYSGQAVYAQKRVPGPNGGLAATFLDNVTNLVVTSLTNFSLPITFTWWACPSNSLANYVPSTYGEFFATYTGADSSQGVVSTIVSSNLNAAFQNSLTNNTVTFTLTNLGGFSVGGWTFYAVVCSSSGTYGYVNGVFEASNTSPSACFSLPNNWLVIGGNAGDSYAQVIYTTIHGFSGAMTDFRIYTNAQTASQISALYSAGAYNQTNVPMAEYNQLNSLTRFTTISPPSLHGYLEPFVLYDSINSKFRMWFTDLTASTADILYAESSNGTNGWTLLGGVAGNGYNSISGIARGAAVLTTNAGTSYILFYWDTGGDGGNIQRIVLDGTGTNVLSGPTKAIDQSQFGLMSKMSSICIDSSGQWHTFLQPFVQNGLDSTYNGQWLALPAFSTNQGLSWNTNTLLATWMNCSSAGEYNATMMIYTNNAYQIWGMYSMSTAIGHSITHWTTTNFSTGTNINNFLPSLDLSGEQVHGQMADQLADPSFVEVAGKTYCYWDVNVNGSGITNCYIEGCVFNGPIDQLQGAQ